MPYSGPGDDSLPERIKKMDTDARAQWVEVFNSAFDKCTKDGGDNCESSAFAQANGVIKKRSNPILQLWEKVKAVFENELGIIERRIKDVQSWDGSASRWDSTAAYCDACLINENDGPRDGWVQAKCHLPVREPGDGSGTYVRQAIHAAAQRFGQLKVSAASKKSAANELISTYNQMDEQAPDSIYSAAGKTPPQRAMSMSRLYEAIHRRLMSGMEDEVYPMDVYVDGGSMYVLANSQGKLFRYPLMVQEDEVALGAPIQVMENHPPVVQARTVIRQQPDGHWRWVAVSATAILNRVGEIDSRELFDSFVAHAEATGEYPIRQFYHQGGKFRTGQADFLAREGYCYLTSGLYDDTPLAQAEIQARLAHPTDWGDSIGYLPTVEPELIEVERGINIPVYRQGINREISTLPERDAANLFTMQEVTRMKGKIWDAFLKLWNGDEEKARRWLEENAGETNRAVDEAGLIARSNDESEPPEPDEPEPTEPEPAEVAIDDEAVNVIIRQLEQSETITGLAAGLQEATANLAQVGQQVAAMVKRVEATEAQLTALQTADDEKLRQLVEDMPRSAKQQRRVVYKPRVERAETTAEEVDEAAAWKNEKEKKGIPSY